MFGQRLKEERNRLKLTQPQLGEIVDLTKRTVIDWEKDKSSPTAIQLAAMAKNGFDVSYLITGTRTQPVALPTDEAFLLDSFRALNAEQKKMALQFLMGGFEGLQSTGNNTNSNNSDVSNSFNTQSGFTELPFIWACTVCGAMAWLLAAVASWKMETDALISMSFGSVAIVLWGVTMIMAVFGYYAGKTKYDEVQAGLSLNNSL